MDRKEATLMIEKEIEKILTTENWWKSYLQLQNTFHNYSTTNALLIYSQFPTATKVGSYNTWKKNNRQVKKGEKGIKIFRPMIGKRKKDDIETAKSDEKEELIGFTLGTVFDISQTEIIDMELEAEKEKKQPSKRVFEKCSGTDELLTVLKNIIEIPIINTSKESSLQPYGIYYNTVKNDPMDIINLYSKSILINDHTLELNENEIDFLSYSIGYIISLQFDISNPFCFDDMIMSMIKGKDMDLYKDFVLKYGKIINKIANSIILDFELEDIIA